MALAIALLFLTSTLPLYSLSLDCFSFSVTGISAFGSKCFSSTTSGGFFTHVAGWLKKEKKKKKKKS
jgi:hypothetical protein